MKKTFILLVSLTMATLSAQRSPLVERSAELNDLYEQAKQLENSTPQEIEANRLAIKNAWMQIDPEIGNLYKPVETYGKLPEIMENVHINGLHSTGDEGERVYEENSQNRWGMDIQIYDGFVDGGVDVITDNLGHIYSMHYESFGTTHKIYIHRSTDEGNTWTLYKEQGITAPIVQAQLVSLHGTGDNYLLAYFLTDSNMFQVVRWNTTTNSNAVGHVISTEVLEFSVDRNYPENTSGQRVFGVYKTTDFGRVRSARSTAGSFGFDWVDESANIVLASMTDFAYGRDGACYFVSVGDLNLHLAVDINNNFNDPNSWISFQDIELGTNRESLNPTIVAARESLANDNVLVFASSRPVGGTGNFDARYYIRTNSNPFGAGNPFTSGGNNLSIIHPDSYIRFIHGANTARLSYVRQVIDASSNNENRSLTYNGTGLDLFEEVADLANNPFSGFKSTVTGEILSSVEPYIVFTGTSGGFGRNLYFDKQSSTLSTIDFNLSDIQVYPNPASTVLHVKAAQNIDQIEVYNYTGQLIKTFYPNTVSTEVSMNELATGFYLVRISAQEKSITHKIIKK